MQEATIAQKINRFILYEGNPSMRLKSSLLLILLALSSVLFATCDDTTDPGANLDYAAKAREIVGDMYTPQDDMQVLNFYDHFETILAILGVQVVDDAAGTVSDATLALTSDCVEDITGGILMEFMQYSSDSDDNSSLQMQNIKMYYPLVDVPGFLISAGWDIEREEGYDALTADDLIGIMDYYISLYENNETIEREQFAGYLMGAIARNREDIGTLNDQYTLDRLQLFLFILDALTLPENSPFAVSDNAMQSFHAPVAAASSGSSNSYWGSGAKRAKVRPQNTNQKVKEFTNGYLKTYAYWFAISGPRSIYCDRWTYTAYAMRTCTIKEAPGSNEPLAPLDCSGVQAPVKGINVEFDTHLQEHTCLGCLLPEQISSDGFVDAEVTCSKKPDCDLKSFTPGTKNVNGYIVAKFSGTDTGVTPPTPILPAKAVLNVSERVGDKFECHED